MYSVGSVLVVFVCTCVFPIDFHMPLAIQESAHHRKPTIMVSFID